MSGNWVIAAYRERWIMRAQGDVSAMVKLSGIWSSGKTRSSRMKWLSIVGLLVMLCSVTLRAENSEVKIIPVNGWDAANVFGKPYAESGGHVIYGSPANSVPGRNAGVASIYQLTGTNWTFEARLTGGDELAQDQFGSAVAIAGDYSFVGAPGDNITGMYKDAGSVYVYHRNGNSWVQTQKITAPSPSNDQQFGFFVQVSSSATNLFVGGANIVNTYTYSLVGTNWVYKGLAPASLRPVVMVSDGEYVVAGNASYVYTYGQNYNFNSGFLQVFKRNGDGTLSSVFMSSLTEFNNSQGLGKSLDVKGGYILAGRNDQNVSIYSVSGTTVTYLNSVAGSDGFGASVMLFPDYDIFCVGCPNYGGGRGCVKVFKLSTLDELRTIVASDSPANAHFGSAMYRDGSSNLIVSAPDDVHGNVKGSLYRYNVSGFGDVALSVTALHGTVADTGLNNTSYPSNYSAGVEIDLLATPYPGYRFVNWSICGLGATQIISTNRCTIWADDDYSVTANFSSVALDVTSVHGYVADISTNNASYSSNYTAGAEINLLATPDQGYRFVNWTICGSVSTQVVASNPCALRADDHYAVTANFALLQFTVASVNPHGSVAGPGTYAYGSTVALTAAPNPGYVFVRWTGDVQSTNNSIQISNLTTNVQVYAHFAVVDNQTFLDFNDQGWNTAANQASAFANDGTLGGNFYLSGSANNTYPGVSFEYNGAGGSCLRLAESASTNYSVLGPVVQWEKKFSLEARLKRGAGPEGSLDLVLDRDSATGATLLRWALDTNGVMQLALKDGQLVASTAGSVLQKGAWESFQAVVDLTQTTLVDTVKFYTNGIQVSLAPEGSGSTYGGAFSNGTVVLDSTEQPVKLAKRGAAFDLLVDFVKISANQQTPSTPGSFYNGEIYSEIASNAAVSILIDPSQVVKRLQNKMSGSSLVGTKAYDTHPNPPCVFHGVFEIKCALDVNGFTGNGLIVDVFLKKPGDIFKKIGEVIPPAKPSNGTWWVTYYWNSRVPAYDWTSDDAQPYKTTDEVQFKFEVR